MKNTIKIQTSSIPVNIQEQNDTTLAQWKEDNENYITTHAVFKVLSCLNNNQSVTVTGSSGTGKTAIMRRVACMMKKKKYIIIPTTQPEEIRQFSQKGIKMLFVFDDVCGNYTLNMNAFERWWAMCNEIENLLKGNDIKIISTCRLTIFYDSNFDKLSVLNKCIFDLSSYELTDTEKKNIALRAFHKNDANEAVDALGKYECFPLLCSLYNKDKHDFNLFIKNPFKFYETELKSLSNSTEEDCKLKFCCLALCVLLNNNLTISFLSAKDEGTRKIRKAILEECGLNRGTSYKCLISSARTLLKSFFVDKNDSFRTIHDKLFDFLSFYIGSKMIVELIKYVPNEFISERFVCEDSECDVCEREEFDIRLSKTHLDAYVERLMADLNLVNLLSNKNINCPKISDLLIEYCKKLPADKQKTLTSTKNELDESILSRFCLAGNLKLVRCVLDMGADINTFDCEGDSPLHKAIINGSDSIIDILLTNETIDADICNKEGNTPLHYACRKGLVNVVDKLILKRASINRVNNTGDSPLHLAISNDCKTVIDKLLTIETIEIDVCNKEGNTPLHSTCRKGLVNVVDKLILKRASINKVNNTGDSPLHIAITNDCKTVIDKLLTIETIEIDVCNKEGNTPLHIAVKINNKYFVEQLLIRNSTNINVCNHRRQTPLRLALPFDDHNFDYGDDKHELPLSFYFGYRDYENDLSIVLALLKKMWDVNKHDEIKQILLHLAAANGNIRLVQELLNCEQFEINCCNRNGDTPLHLACQYGHINIVQDLIWRGTSINIVNYEGESPLHKAIIFGREDIVDELLKEDTIEIDVCNKDGNTPLHYACTKKVVSMVDKLILKKASVQKVNNKGDSPLHLAVDSNANDVVKRLLNDDNIDIDVCNNQKQTPLCLALLYADPSFNQCVGNNVLPPSFYYGYRDYENDLSIVLALLKKMWDFNKDDEIRQILLHLTAANGNLQLVQELLNFKQFEISMRNRNGDTPLHLACQYGQIKIVQELIRRGALINIKNHEGESPLHKASIFGGEGVVDEMLNVDTIEIDLCNDKRNTPLHYACAKGLVNVVDKLLRKGASVQKVNIQEELPLHLAVNNGYKDVVDRLLETHKENHVDIDICNNKGRTPLYLAFLRICENVTNDYNGDVNIAKALIANGADINKSVEKGRSLLHIASEKGNVQMVEEVLKHENTDIDIFDQDGNTPLQLAI